MRSECPLSKRTAVVRMTAVFLLVFYAAAVFRAYVPGMCATLAAAQEGAACASAARSCCSVPEAPADDSGLAFVPGMADHPDCALCKLMTTLAMASGPPLTPGTIFLESAVDRGSQPDHHRWSLLYSNIGRDPPSLLPV